MSTLTKKQIRDGAAALNLSAQILQESVKAVTENMEKSEAGELAGDEAEVLEVIKAADKMGYLASKFVEAGQFLITSYSISNKNGLSGDETKVKALEELLDKELDALQARLSTVANGQSD